MQIYWNRRNRLHKKRVQLPQDWFGTPTWPPFHWFGTSIWPPWRHVKTLYKVFRSEDCDLDNETLSANRSVRMFDVCEGLVPVLCRCCSSYSWELFVSARKALVCAYLPAGYSWFFKDWCYYGNVLLDQEKTLACIYFHSRDEANPLFLRPNQAT